MITSLIRRMNHEVGRSRGHRVVSGVSRRARSCRFPAVERLEDLVLLSSAPVVSLGGSGNSGGGTALVKDIVPGAQTSVPNSLVEAGGRLYFLAVSPTDPKMQLWISDGTSDGTTILTAGLEASNPLALGSSVIFTAFDNSDQKFGIWSSDGTTGGTHKVVDLPRSATVTGVSADGVVYFDILNFVTNRYELWKSDGTAAGTGLVAGIPDSGNFTVAGSKVFFQGSDFASGGELWVSDGTAAGTHLVADISPGVDGSYPSNLTDVDGTLYFTAFEGFGEPTRLWKSDGTAAGTVQVDSDLQPLALADLNGDLIFTATDSSGNLGLWTTGGTAAGSALVTSLPSGMVFPMAVAGGRAFFGLLPDTAWFTQLWVSDGTAAGTGALVDIPDPSQLTASGNLVYFTGDDFGPLGNELWSSDGTPAGTHVVADINPGSASSSPQFLAAVGGVLYFTANDGTHGRELWQSSPSTPQTPTSVDEGSVFIFAGSFADADDAPWTATVNYGDGTGTHPLALAADHTFTLNHQFPDNGTYLVTVTVTDNAGNHGVGSLTVTVLNVAPSPAMVGVPLSSPEGTAVTLTAHVTDPGSVDTAAGFATHWTVTRDGHVFAEGSGTTFSFTPDDNGNYLLTLSATDKDGATGTTSTQLLIVTNAAPIVTMAGVPSGAEGSPIAFTATASDPSPVDQAAGLGLSWTATRNGSLFASGTGGAVSFTPDDDGTYVVTVVAIDKDSGASSATVSITVVNTAPTATITGVPAGGTEGTAISLGSGVTDPSPADTAAGFGAAWTVTRNGTQVASGAGSTFSFVPDDNGVYVVTLTATDKDGGSSSAQATVTVTNVAPTATITGAPATAAEGVAVTLGRAVSDPGAADVAAGFTTQWAVTKDGSPFATGAGSSFSFLPSDNGTYVVTMTASDKDGGSSSAQATVTVVNVVPTAAITGDASGVRGQTRNFVVSASDPAAGDAAAGFTFRINWGDGSPVQTIAPGASTSVGHVFTATGTYTVQVVATDKDGAASLVATKQVKIEVVQLQTDPTDPTRTALVVGGTLGDDTIRFLPGGSTGLVKVRLNGSSLGSFSPTGSLIAYGQAGNDDIKVSESVNLPSILHGDGGNDTLAGGGGDAILIGGGGANSLRVVGGRNLMVGGSGADDLYGVSAGNIVISGTTAYDANDSALVAILKEWQRGTSLRTRVNNLLDGIAGGIKLDSTTVFSDRARDGVVECGGRDWLLVGSNDRVRGNVWDSIISIIDRPGWDS